ncbi:sensor histidine kinase [Paenibacillus sp. P13VS]|uniref:sensor histidine kinase n=1 Tax=Paenibacillus sp. P13VS TaxID=2697367 RepID=UPI001D11C58F|nr:ATP-binding protein [Paenibacillus sp. P13VS]
MKHSGASQSLIHLERTHDGVQITVRDNGHGMPSTERPGNGLKGMSERLGLIDGSLRITSDAGGTILVFSFPLIASEPQGGVK